MDAFGDDDFSASNADTDFNGSAEVDPAADFLAREHDQLAGLEEDIIPESETAAAAPNIQDNDFHTDAFQANYSNEEAGNLFEAQHTFGLSADVDDGFASNGPVAAASVPLAQQNYPSLPREEPEKIRKWREEQKLRLQKKDAEEEKKKTEMKEAARKELEDWYKHHKEAIEKTRLANRNAEKELISQPSELEPGQEWERIAKLCDFNPKASRNSKDVSRMRSIILQLKQTPPTKA